MSNFLHSKYIIPQPFSSPLPNFNTNVVISWPLDYLCICYPLYPSNVQDSFQAASLKPPITIAGLSWLYVVETLICFLFGKLTCTPTP